MERTDWNRRMKRGLLGSALAATLAFAGTAHAEGTAQKSEARQSDQHSTQTQSQAQSATSGEQAKRAPALAGLSREQIKEVQRELAARGLYQGTIDGISGAKTEAALRNFQTQNGMPVGTMNAQTRDALGIESESERQPVSGKATEPAQRQTVSGRTTDSVQKEPVSGRTNDTAQGQAPRSTEKETAGTQLSSLSTEQVKQIQQGLQRKGFYQGEVDGVMGGQTRAALRRYFQHQAQLADQGMVSEPALSMLQSK